MAQPGLHTSPMALLPWRLGSPLPGKHASLGVYRHLRHAVEAR
jgi:hypothetical protein